MIKKIKFTNKYNSTVSIEGLKIYTYKNGDWETIHTGTSTTSTSNRFESNTIKVTRNVNHPRGYMYWIFTQDGSIYANESITIEFKQPLKVLKCIVATLGNNNAILSTIYDENDNKIYEINKMMSGNNKTPELMKMKVYPTNTVGTIVTNDTSHISDVYSISQVTTDETTEDAITDIKYAVSFDGRKTYKVYKNSAWSALSLSNIMTNGMSKTELEALTDSEYDPQLTSDRTFDIVAGMNTNNSEKTPSIKSIIVDYLKISNT